MFLCFAWIGTIWITLLPKGGGGTHLKADRQRSRETIIAHKRLKEHGNKQKFKKGGQCKQRARADFGHGCLRLSVAKSRPSVPTKCRLL